jgi:hypothetical protein
MRQLPAAPSAVGRRSSGVGVSLPILDRRIIDTTNHRRTLLSYFYKTLSLSLSLSLSSNPSLLP